MGKCKGDACSIAQGMRAGALGVFQGAPGAFFLPHPQSGSILYSAKVSAARETDLSGEERRLLTTHLHSPYAELAIEGKSFGSCESMAFIRLPGYLNR